MCSNWASSHFSREWVPELCTVCTSWPGRCGIRGASTTHTPAGCAMNGLAVRGPDKSATQQWLRCRINVAGCRHWCVTLTFQASKARKICLLNRRKHFESSSVASLLACALDIKRWRVNTCAREPRAPGPRATSVCTTRRSIVSRAFASKSKTVQKLETNCKITCGSDAQAAFSFK